MKDSHPTAGGEETIQGFDLLYLKFFECFNQGLFFEAHEFLEALWLPVRRGEDGPFYKGLIQIAGAFVHLQKGRYGPSAALLKSGRSYLAGFRPRHKGVEVELVLALADRWLKELEAGGNPLHSSDSPKLILRRG